MTPTIPALLQRLDVVRRDPSAAPAANEVLPVVRSYRPTAD